MANHSSTARLLVMAAAVLFSTGGAAIKATSLTGPQVAGLRSLVAGIAILLLLPDSRREWRLRFVPIALAYAATLALFVNGTKLTTAANAIFLQSTAPLFVLLIGPLLLKEPVRRSDLMFMGAVAAGMALFFTAGESARASAPDPVRGNLLAAASALTYAFTITGLRWIGRDPSSHSGAAMATVAMGNLFTAVIMLPFGWPVASAGWQDAAVIGWLGLFQVGLAYVCLTRGVRSVPALEATTILLLEPALNPVWAWLMHGERPASRAIAGGVLILGATLVKSWWQSRTRGYS